MAVKWQDIFMANVQRKSWILTLESKENNQLLALSVLYLFMTVSWSVFLKYSSLRISTWSNLKKVEEPTQIYALILLCNRA